MYSTILIAVIFFLNTFLISLVRQRLFYQSTMVSLVAININENILHNVVVPHVLSDMRNHLPIRLLQSFVYIIIDTLVTNNSSHCCQVWYIIWYIRELCIMGQMKVSRALFHHLSTENHCSKWINRIPLVEVARNESRDNIGDYLKTKHCQCC